MALGLLLWLSLLLNFSSVSSTITGQGQTLLDGQSELGDEFFNALRTDQGDGDDLHNEQSGPALVRYNWPLAGSNQNQPNTVDQPKPQTPPVNAKPSLSFASSNAAEYSGQANEVYSPSAHMSLPRKPSKVDQASYKDWLSMPFSDIFNEKLFFGQMEFLPENSVNYDKYWVPMRSMKMAYEMPPPPRPSRKILIRKSKNGYSRERLQQSKDAYWSDVGMQQMKDDRKFKHPLPRKPHNFQASRKVRSPRLPAFQKNL